MLKRLTKCINDPLYRGSFFLSLSAVFNAGCGLLFWMVAARNFSINDVGIATALISSSGLLVLFSRLGFDVSMIRFYPTENKEGVFWTSLIITTLAAFLMGILYIIFSELLFPSLALVQNPFYALIFLFTTLANSVSTMTGLAFVANRRSKFFLYQNLVMATRLPLLIPMALFGGFGILGSIGLAYILASTLAFLFLNKSISLSCFRIDRSFIRRSFRFSLWNYLSEIFFAVPTFILPILIFSQLSKAETAIYYIAFTIGSLIQIIPSSFATSILVEGSHGKDLKDNVKKALFMAILLMVPLVLLFCIFGGYILGLLRPEYIQAFDLLRLFALSSFLVLVYSIYMPIQNVKMRIEDMTKLNLLRCLLLLVISYILVPKYGIIGVGYAWAATYGFMDIIILIDIKRQNWGLMTS